MVYYSTIIPLREAITREGVPVEETFNTPVLFNPFTLIEIGYDPGVRFEIFGCDIAGSNAAAADYHKQHSL